MTIENAIDFLLYSVMGVTHKSKSGDLLEGAIDRAYRDACSHVLSVPDEKKEDVRKEAAGLIEEALERVPVGEGYDEWQQGIRQAVYLWHRTEMGQHDHEISVRFESRFQAARNGMA